MEGIALVLYAVACSGDLLSCVQVPTNRYAFQNPVECSAHKEHTIRQFSGLDPRYPNVMGRCHYVIQSNHAMPFRFAAGAVK
jgi:hypothetical protein